MSKVVNCAEAKRTVLAERYLLGGMARRERARYSRHLESCNACRAQVAQTAALIADLESAAENAGWDAGQVKRIKQLYRHRRGMMQNFNWRLAGGIALLLTLVIIMPFVWWANRPETKMALLVSFEREQIDAGSSRSDSLIWAEIGELHQTGDDDGVRARLLELLPGLDDPELICTAHRFVGLSALFLKQADEALPHLQIASGVRNPAAEEKAYWYIANAHLMLGNKIGAKAALHKVVSLRSKRRLHASRLLEKLAAL